MSKGEKATNQSRTIGATERLGLYQLLSLAPFLLDGGGSSLHRRPTWRYAVKYHVSCKVPCMVPRTEESPYHK